MSDCHVVSQSPGSTLAPVAAAAGKSDLQKMVELACRNLILRTMGSPFNLMKVRLQSQNSSDKSAYTGVGDCWARVQNEEGYAGFFRGNFVSFLNFFPRNFVTKCVYPTIKEQVEALLSSNNDMAQVSKMLVSTLQATMHIIFCSPLETIGVKMIADSGKKQKYRGFFDCFNNIVHKGGIRNLFRGFFVSVLGLLAYRGLNCSIIDFGKRVCFDNFDSASKTTQNFFKGVVHVLVGIMVYPLDTIKHRMISDLGENEPKYGKGTFECAQKIMKDEGIAGFYKGVEIILGPSIFMGCSMVMWNHYKNQ